MAKFELSAIKFKIAVAKLQLETIRLQTRLEGYHLRDIIFIITCGFVIASGFILVFIYTLNHLR